MGDGRMHLRFCDFVLVIEGDRDGVRFGVLGSATKGMFTRTLSLTILFSHLELLSVFPGRFRSNRFRSNSSRRAECAFQKLWVQKRESYTKRRGGWAKDLRKETTTKREIISLNMRSPCSPMVRYFYKYARCGERRKGYLREGWDEPWLVLGVPHPLLTASLA